MSLDVRGHAIAQELLDRLGTEDTYAVRTARRARCGRGSLDAAAIAEVTRCRFYSI